MSAANSQTISSAAFKQWLLSIGKSERTAKSYAGAVENALSQLSIDAGLIDSKLNTIQDPSQFQQVSQHLQQLPAFQVKNEVGKSMYSAALNHYAEFLSDITGQQLQEDVKKIINSETLTATEKSSLVNTRLGQGKFRHQLIEQWQGCAVTGYRDMRFLVASHIKPWRDCDNEERLNPYNGLLLLPNLDKVFDLGYITFEASGKIRVSEQLEDVATLGIKPTMTVKLAAQHQDFMAYHRSVHFIQ